MRVMMQLRVGTFRISVGVLAAGIKRIQWEAGVSLPALARELVRHPEFPEAMETASPRFKKVLRWVPEVSQTKMVWVMEDQLAKEVATRLLSRLKAKEFVRLVPVTGHVGPISTRRWLWNWARCPVVLSTENQLVVQARPAPVQAST